MSRPTRTWGWTWITDSTQRTIPTSSTTAAITTTSPARGCRRSSTSAVCIRTTTRPRIRWTRSASTWCTSARCWFSTRLGSWPTDPSGSWWTSPGNKDWSGQGFGQKLLKELRRLLLEGGVVRTGAGPIEPGMDPAHLAVAPDGDGGGKAHHTVQEGQFFGHHFLFGASGIADGVPQPQVVPEALQCRHRALGSGVALEGHTDHSQAIVPVLVHELLQHL